MKCNIVVDMGKSIKSFRIANQMMDEEVEKKKRCLEQLRIVQRTSYNNSLFGSVEPKPTPMSTKERSKLYRES